MSGGDSALTGRASPQTTDDKARNTDSSFFISGFLQNEYGTRQEVEGQLAFIIREMEHG